MVRIYYCDVHSIDLPSAHPFPSGKYPVIRQKLALDGVDLQLAPLAPLDLIRLVHSEGYVDDFVRGMLSPSAIRRIGFPWSEGLVRRTLTSLGGTLAEWKMRSRRDGERTSREGRTMHSPARAQDIVSSTILQSRFSD